ncbi:hypothetical protein KVP40.0117 [Vibrio phage KVP40]|uniref:Uncharacterized protein n=4 Tax=Schizotequatrovirus KVP40 TaxID=1914019 RepID=Q6WI35_BPKVM|nr:hypothetical protein KVP40.0117 [Vibrio phage KVP40]AFN37347.1 hypothetical protein pp2_114 [Vibrio phage phi-pp2]QHJ74300.1 hypothetical protein VH12019_00381 [Vibrio phage VH1_2019]QIW90918.1 hypothetical protein COHAPHLL_00055 [Vibrio phage V09]UNA02019.1 hypothetical protein [Vibrio phage PC-Liy1]URQ03318.1 hypothetical protein PVA8_332 [Vibrio phage PVA8]WBM59051.1 hypothetical protein vBValMPVA8_329 [Vibrio phage vB_ValM_PVA8]WOL25027.1 hypothetical protein [Vibrio phage PG216]
MDVTSKLELSMKEFVDVPYNEHKTHSLVGQASEHINSYYNNPGEIVTSNVMYVEINGGIVYAVTHSKSRYQLTNVSHDEIAQMVKAASERGINIPLYKN